MSESNEKFNRSGLYAFAFSMLFACVFIIYICFINSGVDLGENVVDPNAVVAGEPQAPAFDIKSISEPWVPNEDVVAYGKKVFSANCAMCHGAEGKGDGAAGAGLNPKPRNFVEGKWTQGEGVTSLYNVLLNGIKGSSMASYAHMPAADRWALVQFIDSVTTNKSKESADAVAAFAKSAK